jgi:hypothetical protein
MRVSDAPKGRRYIAERMDARERCDADTVTGVSLMLTGCSKIPTGRIASSPAVDLW